MMSRSGGISCWRRSTSSIVMWRAPRIATEHKTFPSVGTTPFGFAVGREGHLFVSEAAGGAANASSASSYEVSGDGNLEVITSSAPTRQTN